MAIRETIGKVSVFGWLEHLEFWRAIPYPVKGALLRGLKAGLAIVTTGLLVSLGEGTLFPATWSPQVILIGSLLLQAIDKYIREWNINEENISENINIPINSPITNTDATVIVEEESVDTLFDEVNTDATINEDIPSGK